MENQIIIVVVDSHLIVQKSLRAYLSSLLEFNVVGEVDSGKDVIPIIEQYSPDIALMDLILPEISGTEITRLVKKSVQALMLLY